MKAFLQKSAQKATIISTVITALVAMFFFYLYINLPSTPSQQAEASLNEVSNHDTCGKLQFTFSQNPGGGNVCAIGAATKTNSYTYTVKVTSMDGKSHSFIYDTYNYFCPEGYLGGANCLENGQLHTNVAGQTGDAITMTRTPTTGSFCGRYQMDFKVTAVDGSSSCHFWGGDNTNAGSSGSCQTGVTCGQNSCTPKIYNECEMGNSTFCHDKGGVPTGHIAQVTQNAACGYSCKDLGSCVVPTATPTLRPSATPTPTSTPFPSATPTPTGMPTAIPTPTGIPTVTPTSIPTATPTQPSQNTNSCDNSTQTGNNNANNNCNNNTNNNNNSNNQSQSQTQNNNQNVNVTVSNNNQQEVLAAATTVTPAPTSLPSTGSPVETVISLISLLPVGFGIRKFALKK